jgi:tRNA pseudouridine38-40 synthase
MPNFRLVVAYDGTDFHGWQTQPGLRTVQATLEGAISALAGGQHIRVNASGRTDTGVHALGQVVNFTCPTRLGPDALVRALNTHLPSDVVVRAAEVAADDFDANRHARRKLYRYVIHDGSVPELFLRRYCHHSRYKLDAIAMASAADCLRGTHDFASFVTNWPNRASSVRTITHLAVNRFGDYLWIDVEADGFLYNMVRAIAGTLIDVGRGYRPETCVAEILHARDRTVAGPTAPARGLFLVRVTYDETAAPSE